MTFSCFHRYRLLQHPALIRGFLAELSQLREHGTKILGYVVMPEHVHLVLFPPESMELGREIGKLKSRSARKLLPLLEKCSDQPLDFLYKSRPTGGPKDLNLTPPQAVGHPSPIPPQAVGHPNAIPPQAMGHLGQKRAFWQRRCYDHNCRSPETVREKIEYCHKNPVTRGLVKNPADYPWSSYLWYEGLEGIELEIDGYEL